MPSSSFQQKISSLVELPFSAADAANDVLGMSTVLKPMLIVGVSVVGFCLVAVVVTMCWSVGSGQTNVNQLASTAASVAKPF